MSEYTGFLERTYEDFIIVERIRRWRSWWRFWEFGKTYVQISRWVADDKPRETLYLCEGDHLSVTMTHKFEQSTRGA